MPCVYIVGLFSTNLASLAGRDGGMEAAYLARRLRRQRALILSFELHVRCQQGGHFGAGL